MITSAPDLLELSADRCSASQLPSSEQVSATNEGQTKLESTNPSCGARQNPFVQDMFRQAESESNE